MKIAIVLLLAIISAIPFATARAGLPPVAEPGGVDPTWPSISPSSYCLDGATIFTLINVGTDMPAPMPWTAGVDGRVTRGGFFQLGAHAMRQWAYISDGREFVFAYRRPDSGQWVSWGQTCAAAETPGGSGASEIEPPAEDEAMHMVFAPTVVTPRVVMP